MILLRAEMTNYNREKEFSIECSGRLINACAYFPTADVYYSSDPVDYEVDSESDPNADEVTNDIDDEGVNEDGNVNASSVGNQIRRIVIHNNPGHTCLG
ncbi:hypothetical protein GOBAR_AA39898 [Gossypium barbadense]|uniref:Uncharacterized protein n=1 Tax=Gossypium barbadense TaxID=3634 RepID=A0A2P5VPP9_GOSBA|nr:hypothetical protein GOBAR_AA39898 [Gossypium barbadense]